MCRGAWGHFFEGKTPHAEHDTPKNKIPNISPLKMGGERLDISRRSRFNVHLIF